MSSARRTRRAGDAARDRGDWDEAERNYRAYLRRQPRSAAIWVQLGHAIKEQGRADEALEAYRQATRIAPGDADPWLHLAFLAKDIGRKDEAREAFARSFEHGGERESYEQLLKLGYMPSGSSTARSRPATFFIVDDLLKFMRAHVTLSGIQRVQVGLIESLLKRDSGNYQFIASHYDHGAANISFWFIPIDLIRDLISYAASGEDLQRNVLDNLLERITRGSRQCSFLRDDIVFFPGAFWIIERTGQTCAALKRSGVKIGVYVYDLIPISHPEFCHPELVQLFSVAFTEIIQFADFVATISVYVANVVSKFFEANGFSHIPVTPLPLAHFLTMSDRTRSMAYQLPKRSPISVLERPYALYVSTLEGRKNHIYVVQIWRELMRQGVDMPDLVFVGRKGWRSEGLYDFLDGTSYLSGRVHVLHDVSDGDLALLYEKSQFSLFTSFVEGWGLPVGESLVFGRPCIASGACSIPEVGGDLVDYVDPFNLRDGMDVVRRMATDQLYRDSRAEAIRTGFRPRTWDEVTEGLIGVFEEAKRRPPLPTRDQRLPVGQNYFVGGRKFDVTDLSNLLERPPYLVLGTDFYNPEVFGAWMKGTSGRIRVATELSAGEGAMVALQLATPGRGATLRVALSAASNKSPGQVETQLAAVPIEMSSSLPTVLIAPVQVEEGGEANLLLEVFDYDPHVEDGGREFYVGVISLSYSRADESLDSLLSTFVRARVMEPLAGQPLA